jgi:hypothetical protein
LSRSRRLLGERAAGRRGRSESVGPALDHLDLGDDALGVALSGRLVEVGEQLGAPEPDSFSEGGEGRELRASDRGEEVVEPPFGLGAVGAS